MPTAGQRGAELFPKDAVILCFRELEAVYGFRLKMRDVFPVGIHKKGRKIDGLRPGCDSLFAHSQQVAASNQLIHGPDTDQSHTLTHFLCHKAHEIHHIFRLPCKAGPQLRVLRSHTHGTGIQIAHAHHAAAERDQRRSGEAEFLRAEHTGHSHIAPGHQFAVRLDDDLFT